MCRTFPVQGTKRYLGDSPGSSGTGPSLKEWWIEGHVRYWIGAAGEGDDAGPGTDFYAIAQKLVSITPIHTDMTHHTVITTLEAWCNGVI